MGKGDKRTKRGKIAKGSYGKSRPHKSKKKRVRPAVKVAPAAKKSAPPKKKVVRAKKKKEKKSS